MTHRAEIVYAKSIDKYQIKCVECGALLCEDVAALPPFEAPGECEIPKELGIHVEEKIKMKDIFGGV